MRQATIILAIATISVSVGARRLPAFARNRTPRASARLAEAPEARRQPSDRRTDAVRSAKAVALHGEKTFALHGDNAVAVRGEGAVPPQPVAITPNESARRVDITGAGKPFSSYIWPERVKKAVLDPIRSASGTIVTRGWPLAPRAGERVDHPHHVGLWFNYEVVNGLDF